MMKMRTLLFTAFSLLCVIASSAFVLVVKHAAAGKEQELHSLQSRIYQEQRAVHVLKAEWAYLTDPERVRKVSEKLTGLRQPEPSRIITLRQLPLYAASPPPARGISRKALRAAAYTPLPEDR